MNRGCRFCGTRYSLTQDPNMFKATFNRLSYFVLCQLLFCFTLIPRTQAEIPSRILLTPSVLTSLRQKATNNTPQWQSFRQHLDDQLNQVIGGGAYQGDELILIGDYALGYKALEFKDPATAAKYADKALGLMQSALLDFQKFGEVALQFLARGDGVTRTFSLPDSDIVASSLEVFTAPTKVIAVKRGTNTTDSVDDYQTFLKVSNTRDGVANYQPGVDWRHSGDLRNDLIDWSIAAPGHRPATGATYFVTVASSLDISDAAPTFNGTSITFSSAPATNVAIYVQYVHGVHAVNYSTLAFQQTHAGDGGFNSMFIDDGYTSRYLGKFTSIGYDWLFDYPGFTTAFKQQVAAMLVRWNDYWKDNGYRANDPASNYAEGGYVSRMLTALALGGGRDTNSVRLVNEVLAYRAANVLPLLTNTTTSYYGGYWAEGWNYGQQAARNLILSGLAMETAGLGVADVERAWTTQVINSLISEQPSRDLIYDGGDWYTYPAPFVGKDLLYLCAAATTDSTARANANYIIQNYPDSQTEDLQDLVFRDPSAVAAFWPNAPLERFAPGVGLITARADWNYDSTWFSFQLGNLIEADHQSFAQGQLEIQRGADGLLINANEVSLTDENQDPSTESSFGNLVAIDDNGGGTQNYSFNQGSWFGEPGCRLTTYEATNGYVYAGGDYAAAYAFNLTPGEGTATKLTRQVVYQRPDYLVVHDRASTRTATDPKELRWHFLNSPALNTGNNSWVATAGGSRLFGHTFSRSPLTTSGAAVECPVGSGTMVNRVTTRNASNSSNVTYVTALQTAPASQASMTSTMPIVSTDQRMEGVQIGNCVVLFGADASLDSFTGAITYSVTGSSPLTHHVTDLPANLSCQVLANGNPIGTFLTSAQGTLAFTNPVSGTQVITIQGGSGPTVGAHSLTNYFLAENGNLTITSPAMNTQPSGSTMLVCIGRGNINAFTAVPTDNLGNSPYLQLGTTHGYVPLYPDSGTALYAFPSLAGGSGHRVTATTTAFDEVTLDAVEVKNGGVIQDYQWNEVQQGHPLTSRSVTTTGPATLVAFWWGDGNQYFAHQAVPNNGFTLLDSILPIGSYVQTAVATRDVTAPGTYNVTWDSGGAEGAQLWLVAVQQNSNPVPVIVSQPTSLATNLGATVRFAVTALGGEPLSYRWSRNGTALDDNASISGSHSNQLSLMASDASFAGSYSVVVSNAFGSVTSSNATLAFKTGPTITSQPSDLSVNAGTTATFVVGATSADPLAYQWRFGGANLPGATKASLSVASAQPTNAGGYQVVVSDLNGSVTSRLATLTVISKPVIVTQPQSQTANAGSNVTFSVVASGTGLAYQWQFNAMDLPGATDSSLSFVVSPSDSAGAYMVNISNAAGSVKSTKATLTVNVSPVITMAVLPHTNLVGTTVTFAGRATGTPLPGYQWKFKGVNIAGATTSALSISNITTASGGSYSLIVSNVAGQAVSSASLTVALDVTPPLVTITSPTAGQSLALNRLAATGTATDNARVTNVSYTLNGGPGQTATTTNGWKNWLAVLDGRLVPGTNRLSVQAGDFSGNVSANSTRTSQTFFLEVPSLLTVKTNGQGTLSANLDQQSLFVGQDYVVQALPASGWVFTNWLVGSSLSYHPNLTFTMQSNLVLQARFVPSPFTTNVAGTYTGLFYETNGVAFPSSGLITFTVDSAGACQGNVYVAGANLPFVDGRFAPDGTAHLNLSRARQNLPDLSLDLQLDLTGGTDSVVGTVRAGNGDWSAAFYGDRAVFTSVNPTPYAGRYTLALPESNDPAATPTGNGYGLLTVADTGLLTLSGNLGDGTKATQVSTGISVSKEGVWPFYLPLYAGGGSALGWIRFTNAPGFPANLTGSILWIKQANATNAYYPAGFTNVLSVMGSGYVSPATGSPVLSQPVTELILSGADLPQPLTNGITLTSKNTVVITPNPYGLSVRITPATGLFTGSFLNSTTGITNTFSGSLLQPYNLGTGEFMSTHRAGSVDIH